MWNNSGGGGGEGNSLGHDHSMSHVCGILSTCLFVWFDSLRSINNLSVKQGRVFLGWTSSKCVFLKDHNAVTPDGEARTRDLSVSSQALYHWAIALPLLNLI